MTAVGQTEVGGPCPNAVESPAEANPVQQSTPASVGSNRRRRQRDDDRRPWSQRLGNILELADIDRERAQRKLDAELEQLEDIDSRLWFAETPAEFGKYCADEVAELKEAYLELSKRYRQAKRIMLLAEELVEGLEGWGVEDAFGLDVMAVRAELAEALRKVATHPHLELAQGAQEAGILG